MPALIAKDGLRQGLGPALGAGPLALLYTGPTDHAEVGLWRKVCLTFLTLVGLENMMAAKGAKPRLVGDLGETLGTFKALAAGALLAPLFHALEKDPREHHPHPCTHPHSHPR